MTCVISHGLKKKIYSFDLLAIETPRILTKANSYLLEKPRTVTADLCERSRGDAHDFYSEGDYWWPNPEDPDGHLRRMGKLILPILFSPEVYDSFERNDGNIGFGFFNYQRE